MEEIKKYAQEHVVIVLIGTKSDLVDKREVRAEEARELAEHFQISYFETSARKDINITEAVQYLATEIQETYGQLNDF